MRRFFIHSVIPLIIIVISFFIAKQIIKSKPGIKRRKPKKISLTVEVKALEKSDFQIWLKSYGTVEPRTQSTLISEVAGKIISVSPKFRTGEFFKKGDTLLEINPQNYKTAVIIANTELLKAKRDLEVEKSKIKNYGTSLSIAEANLTNAMVSLKEEEAQSRLAVIDWQKIGKKGKPGELFLRKPQLISAKSQLESAKAQLERRRRDLNLGDSQLKAAEAIVRSAAAQLKQKNVDLNRTVIKASYAGRIRKQNVDIGQYVSTGTILADIYATDYAEVRLPLKDNQIPFIKLSEPYSKHTAPFVRFTAESGTWEGFIVRTEGVIDAQSQQLFVVARIDSPYGKKNKATSPLRVGQFVEAKIKGILLKDIFIIPNSALREGNKVLIVDESDHLSIKEVHVIWSTNKEAVVDSGVSTGERLCLTHVKYVTTDKPVKVKIKRSDN